MQKDSSNRLVLPPPRCAHPASLLLALRAIPLDSAIETMFSTDVYLRMGRPRVAHTIPLMEELIPLFQGGGVCWASVQSQPCCLPYAQSLRIALGCFAVMAILLQGDRPGLSAHGGVSLGSTAGQPASWSTAWRRPGSP